MGTRRWQQHPGAGQRRAGNSKVHGSSRAHTRPGAWEDKNRGQSTRSWAGNGTLFASRKSASGLPSCVVRLF